MISNNDFIYFQYYQINSLHDLNLIIDLNNFSFKINLD